MSMPDATPAELMTPSSTTRCSRSTVTPASRASRVPKAPQCVVACRPWRSPALARRRSEEHTSELQSLAYLVCRLLLEKKKSPFSSVYAACYRELQSQVGSAPGNPHPPKL